MKKGLLISGLLACTLAMAQEGRRIEAGPSFLEPLQKRDSVLVWDQFHYGMELKDVKEGTPVALPAITEEIREKTAREGHLAILGDWQIDSVKVSSRKDTVARYDIKAYLTLAPEVPGQYELFPLECLVGADTLVFIHQMMDVKEPSIDMETFEPNDIKPQVKFPYTFKEVAPWVLGILAAIGLIVGLVIFLVRNSKKAIEARREEPAHIRALRKLEQYRGEKYWKPEHQKAFYSGVTDTLREYIASRYGFGAMEMTTAEIFDSLKGSELTPELYNAAKDLFERADFVKFAKFTATDEDNATVLPTAVRFVSSTYIEDLEKEEDEKKTVSKYKEEDE